MTPQPSPADELSARRKRAARTAWLIAAIALAVYAGFLITGAVGT